MPPNRRRNWFIPCLILMLALFCIFLVALGALIAASIAADRTDDVFKGDECDSCTPPNKPCQQGLKVNGHNCLVLNKKINSTCETSCYAPGTYHDPQKCQYVDMELQCVGSTCLGTCATTADCINITSSNALLSITPDCQGQSCQYSLDVSGFFDTVVEPCDSTNPTFVDICDSLLNASEPLVQDNCFVAAPVCSNTSLLTTCVYRFGCAPPQPVIII